MEYTMSQSIPYIIEQANVRLRNQHFTVTKRNLDQFQPSLSKPTIKALAVR
jgi:hypothetical protein